MTKEELKEFSENNRLQKERFDMIYPWAIELGWKFDTKMSYLNFYIPNTNFRYDPTYKYWMGDGDFYDKIFITENFDYFDGESLFEGIIKSKEDLENKMKKLGIPVNKIENKGVLAQIREGKNHAFTEDQKVKFTQSNLEKLLFDIENNKLHTGFIKNENKKM